MSRHPDREITGELGQRKRRGLTGRAAPLLLCLLAVGWQLSWAPWALAGPIQVEVVPKEPVVGGMAAVVMEAKDGVVPVEVRMGRRRFPLERTGGGRWFSLLGFPLGSSAGLRLVSVVYQEGGRREIYPVKVEVRAKEYPAEYIQVPERMVEFDKATLRRVLADQRAIAKVCQRVSGRRYWRAPFIMPVRSKIKSPFGLRRFFNGKPRSPHSGVDLRAPLGTPVRAANSGVVVLVRRCYLSGNTVVIDHGEGLFTLYAHLARVRVHMGELVERGQVIGLAGKSGRATGPHLHWGVSLYGHRLDPLALLRVTAALKEAQF